MLATSIRLRRSRSTQSGLTLIELTIAMPILLVASYILLTTIVLVSDQQESAGDNAVVTERLRAVLEQIRNEELEDVLRLYDPDPFNDPDGPGTAPGDGFSVRGVEAREDDPDGQVGQVRMPWVNVSSDEAFPIWELREDMEDRALGMPRDLDGSGQVDALDHTADLRILPVLVEAEWQGRFGPRSARIFTLLTEVKR